MQPQFALASCHAVHCKCDKLICAVVSVSVVAFLSHAGSQQYFKQTKVFYKQPISEQHQYGRGKDITNRFLK